MDIDELCAYTSLQDWIQDNDTDGTLAAKRDTALEHLDPLLEERSRIIKDVVRTYNVLRNASTNSSGAADPTYDALSAAHQQAKGDRFANDALIRGTLESHRAELDNVEGTRKAATTPPARAATTLASITTNPSAEGHSVAQSMPSPPGFTTPPAYLYILEHHALKWPSNDDRASLMERISVSALRAGMVLSVLQFGGPEAFASFVEPDVYYVAKNTPTPQQRALFVAQLTGFTKVARVSESPHSTPTDTPNTPYSRTHPHQNTEKRPKIKGRGHTGNASSNILNIAKNVPDTMCGLGDIRNNF